ncbi:60S ribosomal protein L31 [Candidatus Woesearchaeota archaeon]|nr:60S ribosomal protein L31 [Candidatus Woesearchaeota archaeon]
MAKKTTEKTIERTYNVPLRKEYMKAPRWNRTKKAVTALRQFLVRHMKSEDVRLSKELNEEMWKHGIKNPPHHVKVKAVKDEKGVVMVELFGAEKPASKKVKTTKKEKKTAKTESKAAKEETTQAE